MSIQFVIFYYKNSNCYLEKKKLILIRFEFTLQRVAFDSQHGVDSIKHLNINLTLSIFLSLLLLTTELRWVMSRMTIWDNVISEVLSPSLKAKSLLQAEQGVVQQ